MHAARARSTPAKVASPICTSTTQLSRVVSCVATARHAHERHERRLLGTNPCIIDLSPPSAAAMLPLCRPRKTAPPGLRGWLRRPPTPSKKAHTSPIPMAHPLIGMPAPPANGERKRVGSGSPGVMDLRLEPGEGEALAVGCGRGLCSTVPPRYHPLGRAAQSGRGCSQPAPRAPKASCSP